MEIPKDFGAIYNPGLRPRSPLPSARPVDILLADYRELIGAPVTFALPAKGLQVWYPTPKWVEERCNIFRQLFDKGDLPDKVYERKVHGGFSEIVAPIVIDTIVRQVTGNDYICIPALPQLDMENPRMVEDPDNPGEWTIDKSADAIIGRVIREEGQVKAIEPVMFFDIKAGERGIKDTTRIGVGYNTRLGVPFPVGIFYAGDLRFEDTHGQRRSAKDYFMQVVEPMVRQGEVPWQVTWPLAHGIPNHNLFRAVMDELGKSCYYTARSIGSKGQMPKELQRMLLTNVGHIQDAFSLSREDPHPGRQYRREDPSWRVS